MLAGGRPDELSARQPGIANKAFLHVAGVALVERTLRGLRESQRVGRIVVVAPPGTHGDPALALADECRADGARITDSLAAGLAGLPPDETILVAAADLPVLRAAAVDDFVARALERSLDVGYGCVERRAHVAQYAHVRHTWARLRDGTYCGAGLVVLRPRVFAALERFMESLGRSRKNPLALTSLFGWDMLLLFAAGALSIAKAETRASSLLGAPAGALVSPYPEIAVNVDRPADVAVAERLVAGL